jgi:hypothetical protein
MKKNRVLSEVVSGESGPLEEPVVCRRVLASRSANRRDRPLEVPLLFQFMFI